MIFERGHFRSSTIQKSMIYDSLNESRTFSSKTAYSTKPTVFLSHKHNDLEDEEELKGFMGLLINLGAKIYIDSMDNKMPDQTSGTTAKRIKEMISFCKKFILLGTEKAIESYWCNWELGIGDVHKYMKNIAILPIKEKGENDSRYKGNEYLQIYPRINFNKAFNDRNGQFQKEGYYVEEPQNKEGIIYIKELSIWLNE